MEAKEKAELFALLISVALTHITHKLVFTMNACVT